MGLELVGWLAFAGYRIGESVTTAPSVWQDSEAYRAVADNGWLSSGLWAGARAPGTPVFMKLTGAGYVHYSDAEAVIGVLAWGLLAWTVGRTVGGRWRAVVGSWAVLGFATAPLVAQWDWSALSESPSLSALAVLCTLGFLLVRRFTWLRLAALGVTALAYVLLRDADIWAVAAVGVVLVATGAIRSLQGVGFSPEGWRATLRANLGRVRQPLLVGATLVVVAAVGGVAAGVAQRDVMNMDNVFYVRVFPSPDMVAWFSAHGMPEARQIDALAASTPVGPGVAKLVAPDWNASTWKPLDLWMAQRAQTTYGIFLFTHPVYVLRAPFSTPPLTFDNANGQLGFYAPPGRALSLFQTVFVPGRWVVVALGVLSVIVALGRRLWRERAWCFIAAFAVVGLVTMLIAWHGDAQEVTRHMVEGDVEARLGVLLSLVFVVLAPTPGRATGEEAGEEAGAQRSTPRINPLVGTPVPAVTTTCSVPSTWLTAVPRT